MYTILFLITLVVVCGFIAYIGDFLGRKMGKKRLTLFGLRPRHTAIVVTTITGMVIAVVTLATIMGVNSTIREVLVAGEQKIKHLTGENESLAGENRSLHRSNVELQQKEKAYRRDFEQAKADIDKATKARDAAAAKVADLSNQIALHLRDLNDLKSKKTLTEEQLREKAAALELLEKELAKSQEVLAKTNDDLREARKQLVNADRQVKEQFAKIQDQEKAINAQQKLLQDQYAQLHALGMENLALDFEAGRLRTRDLVIERGEELTRKVIDPDQDESAIGADIISVLNEASEKAASLGAGGKSKRAVVLIKPGTKATEMECISAVAESIKNSRTPIIVIVKAFSNTIAGEPALVEFELRRNELAFAKGTRLASTIIDGRQPEGKILLSVIHFLRTDVRKAADIAGVVRVANSEPDIQGDQMDELMELVSKIKNLDRPVRLRVIAERDIYAAGPFNLKTLEFAISTTVNRASR